MNIYIKLIHISILLAAFGKVSAQAYLTNASIEDLPADATMPTGWFAASEGTTPDILPGYWGVYLEPEDGESYVGLISRSDDSYESMSQRLKQPLDEGTCYSMGLYLAHSDNYTGYNEPLKARIWIADKKNKRTQLIYESSTLDDEEWQYHKFNFTPEKEMKYLIIEAYNHNDKAVKGNILIDGISEIYHCDRV